MLLMLAIYGVAAGAAPWLVGRLGTRAFVVLSAVPAAAFVATLTASRDARAGTPYTESVPWIPGLDVDLAFRLDTLSWAMSLLVTGVGALVLFYCWRYFSDDEPGLGRFAATLTGFAGAMNGLVVADGLILLYVFWELTTIFSYLLIGHLTTRPISRRAAIEALVVTTAGGLAMLVGLIILAWQAGTDQISEIVANPPSGNLVTVAVYLLLAGAVTKSALVPFHFWLPAAMAAPTPVSAYLHAAAMVKAGVYLVALLAPGFADIPGWRPLLVTAGLLTMWVGAWRALRQHDLKLLLAYGTVSQLGFLTLLLSIGTREAALAGLAMLLAHGLFKAALFLTVGVIDHCTGTRDIRKLSGLGHARPVLALGGTLAALSMAGVPPFAGFVAKEAGFTALLEQGTTAGRLVLAGVVIGSALTAAYSARFVWGAFARKAGISEFEPRPERASFLLPSSLLGLAGLVTGLAAGLIDPWLAPYADTLPPAAAEPYHLALWHGMPLALGLSALALAAGAGLFLVRDRFERLQARLPVLADAEHGYQRLMRGLDTLAIAVTGRTQVGSLSVYLAVILSVLVAGLGTTLALNEFWPKVRLWDQPAQAIPVILIAMAAIAATRATKRFTAVVIVGVVGYSIGLIFAMQGAPDLALTQMLVESITLVVFILVLRRLPTRMGALHGSTHRRARAVLAVFVGVVMMGVTAAVVGVRAAAPVSAGWADLAYSFGGGKNIVNVALVDIRAWDTMGEISVLIAAATGVASLVFIRRRTGAPPRIPVEVYAADPDAHDTDPSNDDQPLGPRAWLLAGRTLAPENRSIILEVVVRLLFHTAIIVSLYLLFAGHNRPGGGFAGGLVVGLALIARYLAAGRYELGEALPVDAGVVLGLGLVMAVGTGLAGLVFGGQVLESVIWQVSLPVFGEVKLVTSLFFDIGVYLVVVGLLLDVLRSLGAEVDRQGVDRQGIQAGQQ
jgi:multicomponent Na+:H+ antiporter subunit A